MSETTYSQNSIPYSELSDRAKKLLNQCHAASLCSPLELCRMKQENATGIYYDALLEGERYLINE